MLRLFFKQKCFETSTLISVELNFYLNGEYLKHDLRACIRRTKR